MTDLIPMKERTIPWFRDQGDRTLRLNYDCLDENSLVLDLGGYHGQWASDIFGKYCCSVHIFEPVKLYAENIEKRFKKNPKISVHAFGLGPEDAILPISIANNSSSFFTPEQSEETEEAELVDVTRFLKDHAIDHIDLMKVNIEGGEYDLLDAMIATGDIQKVENLQVQFHDFVPDAVSRMEAIQEQLGQTHQITYQYVFVWENWERKIK